VILHLIRHGQSEWNAERRVQGQADPPLTGLGVDQARAAADALADRPLSAVLSSDLQRACATAAAVAEPHGLVVVGVAGLREQRLGVLEGLPMTEALQRSEGMDWTDPDAFVPGGESLRQVYDRVAAALRPVCAGSVGVEVAVVSHGDAIRMARCALAGEPIESAPYESVPTGSVTTLQLDRNPFA
jgi:broad specificity phosphatase PhoE